MYWKLIDLKSKKWLLIKGGLISEGVFTLTKGAKSLSRAERLNFPPGCYSKQLTLISLITVEVGINVYGCKSCKINWTFSINF